MRDILFLGPLVFVVELMVIEDARFTVRSDDYMTSLLARILSSTTSETSSPKSIRDVWTIDTALSVHNQILSYQSLLRSNSSIRFC
jgi:hypothetical protein